MILSLEKQKGLTASQLYMQLDPFTSDLRISTIISLKVGGTSSSDLALQNISSAKRQKGLTEHKYVS